MQVEVIWEVGSVTLGFWNFDEFVRFVSYIYIHIKLYYYTYVYCFVMILCMLIHMIKRRIGGGEAWDRTKKFHIWELWERSPSDGFPYSTSSLRVYHYMSLRYSVIDSKTTHL